MNELFKLKKNIQENIINMRDIHQWTQSDLAREIRVTSSCINQIEKGNRLPSLIILKKLSICFNISIQELIDDNDLIFNYNKDKKFLTEFNYIRKLSDQDKLLLGKIAKRFLNNS